MADSTTESETNLATIYEEDSVGKFREISSRDLLDLAKAILFYLFVLVIFVFALSYTMVYFARENPPLIKVVDTILDITKTAVPSIVTLVLGFYFGKRDTPADGSSNSGG